MFRKFKAKEFDASLTVKYCISLLRTEQKDNDLKEILTAREKDENSKIPSDRRQRSTLNFMASKIGAQAGWATKWEDQTTEQFNISRAIERLMGVQRKLEELAIPPPEKVFDDLYGEATFFDDVTGSVLKKKEAIKARQK